MTDLERIDTIAVVLMENRSFDHILGHLSLDVGGTGVDGLKAPLNQQRHANFFAGEAYFPFHMEDRWMPADLPHERDQIKVQLAESAVSGAPTMRGFVEAYFTLNAVNRTLTPEPMGFFTAAEVPITNFLARSFAVCDRWFAPLPASTQPNRLMALAGESPIDSSADGTLSGLKIVLDWLEQRKVRWRVYHAGLPFLLLIRDLWDDFLFGPNFKWFPQLAEDVANEAPGEFPEVILIEPSYHDAAVHLGAAPNDNHPPMPVAPGEAFLRDVYMALTRDPIKWSKTMLIVTSDEHGGFYDHVPPLRVRTNPPAGVTYEPFETTGVRVPTLVVSPFVNAGSVCSENFDHTSILQLIAERFDPGSGGYSAAVNARRDGVVPIRSASRVLNRTEPRVDSPQPPPAPPVPAAPGVALPKPPPTPNQVTFANAAAELMTVHPQRADARFPGLKAWFEGR